MEVSEIRRGEISELAKVQENETTTTTTTWFQEVPAYSLTLHRQHVLFHSNSSCDDGGLHAQTRLNRLA
jgi:hypothetical protein